MGPTIEKEKDQHVITLKHTSLVEIFPQIYSILERTKLYLKMNR